MAVEREYHEDGSYTDRSESAGWSQTRDSEHNVLHTTVYSGHIAGDLNVTTDAEGNVTSIDPLN